MHSSLSVKLRIMWPLCFRYFKQGGNILIEIQISQSLPICQFKANPVLHLLLAILPLLGNNVYIFVDT